jgi:hypothetical protein
MLGFVKSNNRWLMCAVAVGLGCNTVRYDHRPPADSRSGGDVQTGGADANATGDGAPPGDAATQGDTAPPGDSAPPGDTAPPGDSTPKPACESPPCWQIADSRTVACADAAGTMIPNCDTGPTAGQDASVLTPAPHYEVNGPIVTDLLNGLEWYSRPSDPLGPDAAAAYCTALGQGWRLPTVVEAESLKDYGYSGDVRYNASVDVAYFPEIKDEGFYWTSQAPLGSPDSLWTAYFGGFNFNQTHSRSEAGAALCVRGAALPNARFRYAGVTLVDQKTGLVWQNSLFGESNSWAGALAYCLDFKDGGADDWRLPTIKELITLVDYETADDATFPEVQNPTDAVYWSATPDFENPRGVQVYTLRAKTGRPDEEDFVRALPEWKYDVRCVRQP